MNGPATSSSPDARFHADMCGGDVNVILKRFTNLRPLGRGAQGVVYTAYDSLTKTDVAIKRVVRPFQTAQHAKRAYRELALMGLCHHKNIVRLITAFTAKQSPQELDDFFLVMELMDSNLCKVVDIPLDHGRLSFLLYQLFCGIKHLHEAGIVHRDLKPSNVVVNAQAVLKILDFGLSRTSAQGPSFMTEYVVTRYYRAPEVILGIGYTTKVDVWSIGCIFGELIRGNVCFPGTDQVDQWTKIVIPLGTPTDEAFLSRLQDTVRQYITKKTAFDGFSFEQLFPDDAFPADMNDKLNSREARSLLSKMLVIDPEKRISVEDALRHPYVNCWYDPTEVDAPPPTAYKHDIELEEKSIDEWKQLIWHEIRRYEPTWTSADAKPVPIAGDAQ